LVVGAAVLAVIATACGGGGGGGGNGGSSNGGGGNANGKGSIIVGTTDKVTSIDPAGSYDLGSWTLEYNLYQSLLRIPAGQNKPVPDAAKKCDFTGPKTYKCTLKSGLKFWNGDPLTAKDVAFSFKRVVGINDPNGPAVLLGSMKSVQAKGKNTVVFHLKQSDVTWPFILANPSTSIVDAKVFPKKKLKASAKVVGSGVYKLKSYKPGEQAVLVPNSNYSGDAQVANKGTIVKYEQQASTLKLDLEQGNVDVAYRQLSPTDVSSLKGDKGVKIVKGRGTEIRYLVFDLHVSPSKKLAVRKSIAHLINRQSIAKNVYDGTVQPLYSMVPKGLVGYTDAYKKLYGASPDKAAAKKALKDAGISTPVKITLWYTPSHYGPLSGDEYTEIKRELDGSGLFKVSLNSSEWQKYQKQYVAHDFQGYELGWFPDYPDADDYLAPFYLPSGGHKGGFYQNGYDNKKVISLIGKEKSEMDKTKRVSELKQVQTQAAKDIPTIPVWQGNQVVPARSDITGVKKTLDVTYEFRYWLIGKNG
jgi:peptide/nickel transport system substrate-binding protein